MSEYFFRDLVIDSRTGLNPRKNFVLGNGDNFYVTIKDIHDGKIFFSDKTDRVDDEAIALIKRRSRIKNGDVLFVSIGRIGETAIVHDKDDSWDVNESVFIFTLDTDIIDAEYFCHLMRSRTVQDRLQRDSSGSTFKSIKMKQLEKMSFKIPEIDKQRVVVRKLAKTAEQIAVCNTIIEKLDFSIKARFVEMFGDPERGEIRYQTSKLKDLSLKISDGVHAKPEYTETGRPFLSVVNINKKKVDFTDCKYVSEEAYQKMIKSTHPQRGDVLYTKVGATYGIPAYVDTDIEFCLYVSVCLIKPQHEKINSRFLALQMDMPFIKHQADGRIKGIGVPDLHLNQISDFDIVCPPREEQDEFVSFVQQVDKSKSVVQNILDKLTTLQASLMQEYFG